MKASRESAREHQLASEDVRLKLAALARAIVLDALQPDGRGFGRARSVDVRRGAACRAGMEPGVPDLVRNQQRPRRPVAVGFAADAAALIVVECARALQRRIAGRQPDKLEVEVRRSRLDQRQGIERVGALSHQRLMEG